ncbi:hypothetical protein C9374_002682 [Naegleria lovaniensis]|uniref:Uncharacterized protein n=1 Tax=Naegleria lovaniensis TaxID=51637 RepID=A0AA88GPZ8_NAELO|nr:uncharacterized protein C9374_002682 [Naegleria lovaniensis]KAG2386236.1 hypothetical protein C9374_002682 [Naegleria lovaniensis]
MIQAQPKADFPTPVPKISKKRRSNKKSTTNHDRNSCLFHFPTATKSSIPTNCHLNTPCLFQTMYLQDKSMIAVSKRAKQDKCQPYEQVLDIVVNDPASVVRFDGRKTSPSPTSSSTTSEFFIKSGFLFVKPPVAPGTTKYYEKSRVLQHLNDETGKSTPQSSTIIRKGRTSMLSIYELLN